MVSPNPEEKAALNLAIEKALATAAGNRTRAAEILKINRRLLYDKLREYGLE